MRLAHEAGHINVCVLTDYDIDGINMWRIANEKKRISIKRIGITQDIVKWLQQNGHDDIDLEDVEEEYTPNPKLFRDGDDPYLQEKRIELDSIIQKVGPKAFWKYIVHQLETEFPGPRDYREIVPEPEPEDYYPDKLNELLEYIATYTKQVYTPKWEQIKESDLKDDIFSEFLRMILFNDDASSAVEYLKESVRNLEEKKVDPDTLKIWMELSRDPASYKVNNIQKKIGLQLAVKAGDSISY